MTVLKSCFFKARKEHQCFECQMPIEVGTRYVREAIKVDDGILDYKAHEDCRDAYLQVWYMAPDSYGNDGWFGLREEHCRGNEDVAPIVRKHYPEVAKRMGMDGESNDR